MWKRKGLIHSCNIYETGYAQDAFIDVINDSIWRIYYSTRTKDSISYPYYIDVEAGNPMKKIKMSDTPLLCPGAPGTFDETGITPTSIVTIDENRKYLYYCGWNRRSLTPYALSIGCVEVLNNNEYRKISDGPIMDRSIYNPIAVSAPCVIRDGNVFRMWYISFLSWDKFNEKLEPTYVVKHATSEDGIDWKCDSHICIKSDYYGEAIGRPWVIKDEGIYKMWISTRGIENYRTKSGQHYMIEYAESNDGINWKRRRDKFSFPTSENGWDSEMLEYASVTKYNNKYYMLYNGNDFGKTGFGYAESE
ncbi:MAG: hypothetical protein WBI07_15695 [Mobilitalea sp.]